jgi:carboxymethylenebutenolidase
MRNPDHDAEFDSLRPGTTMREAGTRRTALKAAIGVGHAGATWPVAARARAAN